MAGLLSGLQGLVGLGSLICFILVIVSFFQKGEQKLGIICLVLILACGLGGLVAFVTGWMNASKLGIQQIMMAWTGCVVLGMLLAGIRVVAFH